MIKKSLLLALGLFIVTALDAAPQRKSGKKVTSKKKKRGGKKARRRGSSIAELRKAEERKLMQVREQVRLAQQELQKLQKKITKKVRMRTEYIKLSRSDKEIFRRAVLAAESPGPEKRELFKSYVAQGSTTKTFLKQTILTPEERVTARTQWNRVLESWRKKRDSLAAGSAERLFVEKIFSELEKKKVEIEQL